MKIAPARAACANRFMLWMVAQIKQQTKQQLRERDQTNIKQITPRCAN
jgi:hypothetical protein